LPYGSSGTSLRELPNKESNVLMLVYVIIAIGALWGILTLVSLDEEEKYIQELCESARKATEAKTHPLPLDDKHNN
jgi:hypothetical protein